MLKVRALMHINAFIILLIISLNAAIVGCASNPKPLSGFESNGVSAISKNTLSDAGEPINIDTRPTGVVWQLMPEAPGGLIAQGNGLFVSLVKPVTSPKVIAEVGYQPYISTNGRDWAPTPSRIPTSGRSLIFANGWFYNAGEGVPPHNFLGVIVRSKDGVNWEKVYSRGSNPFTNIRYLNGGFVVTGQYGVVATSRDGKHWQQQQIKTVPAFYDADYFEGEYLLTGDAMALYASNDLANWRSLSTENLLSAGPRNLQHNSDTLLLQAADYLYIYRDKKWLLKKLPKDDNEFDYYISKLSPLSEDFMVTNKNKQVLKSRDGINWKVVSQLRPADLNNTCESRCIVYDYQIVKLPEDATE
ncbi:hypothetical protein ES754_00855 [Psychrobacter frigidicola]|uniref:Exo-alpha-sialidase n=1 Tax=Psychrobacter frigidicola TaxID=45611 RepID=A0A5C7A2H1_9GAMM|nr:hypothetical protein [Psychrobacter frigidicola]TXD97569.1 hypothetical protein ES754_00855 [Psychrobacter frigidicola]